MKGLKALFFVPVLAFALQPNQIRTQISFAGEPMTALKAIQQGFSTLGYKYEITAMSMKDGYGEVHGTAVGIKPFSAETLNESFAEEEMAVENADFNEGSLRMVLDAKEAVWNAPLIGNDEGVELQRPSNAQWFRIQGGQTVRIEPPYVGKWYPEIAVLDGSMRVLYSYRSPKSKEAWEIELPEEARYLKVSNVWGMKLLKEGMWVESITPGR